jgi:Zn-dependent alcohol dehydrogenase
VFAGYAEYHVDTDPSYRRLTPTVRRRQALIGRAVDVGLPTVGFGLDATPGRHIAVLGTSIVGADIVHAAALSLAAQHEPGTARFVVAGFAAAADPVITHLTDSLTAAGHHCVGVDAAKLRIELAALADPDKAPFTDHTYLVVFAADVAASALAHKDTAGRVGLTDLRTVLNSGPGRGIHLISWWRVARRFADAIGGSAGREDVACLVALNVPTNELVSLVGDHTLTWQQRTNRALLLDRHDQRAQLIVPYVRPGRHDDTAGEHA